MRILIVAKTRRGAGACVGGLTREGRSVRLVAMDAERNEHAGLEYNVGQVWEIESIPDPHIIPPHVENIIVRSARYLTDAKNLEAIIRRFMPPVTGGPGQLFDGRLQHLPSGALYIAEKSGLPSRSTMFWEPDQALVMDCEGKRIRYRYPASDGGRLLTFVGFQEPIEVIPAGTLLRVSLAHWWRPKDRPEEELRCHLQLSGWLLPEQGDWLLRRGAHQQSGEPQPSDPPAPQLPDAVWDTQAPPSSRQHDSRIEPGAAATRSADFSGARQVLKRTFGFAEFLPLQAEIVARVLGRKDTLVIMPTGGGKSLCYQLPALLLDGLTVVVSPLIALMQDQVSQLRELGVGAAFLNSSLSYTDYVRIANQVRAGDARILYVAPETLLRPETLVLLEQSRLACLAVDEAHCISEWGHDFRPEYRQIQQVRQRFESAVCVALTATATPRVRQDILHSLGIEPAGTFVASFNRPNLFLAAQPRRDGLGQTLAFLEQRRGQAGIIYCSTRKQVDELAAELNARGWPTLPYHAGLESEVRRRNQDEFIRDDAMLMVATVAFGMGINKSNVRFVLHYNLPKDLESYYQEIGRAGRDGLPADCLLLYRRADAVAIRRRIDEGAESERPGRQARLDAMMRYAEAAGCRRGPLVTYFGETLASTREAPPRCGHCDNCLTGEQPSELIDVTVAAQKFLSCVRRTGELFGPTHIIDVLRGSQSQRVLAKGHDQLSTHGIGTEFSKEEWRELAQQFLEQGLVEQDLQFGGLRLTAKARPVLQGEKVLIRRTRSSTPSTEVIRPEHDPALLDQLRRLRRELADEAGVPAYIVFSDRALLEMAARRPQNPEQFLAINGVGEAKLARYGNAFLKVIRGQAPDSGASDQPANSPVEAEPILWLTAKRRFQEIGESFAAGSSLDELAVRFSVKRATIVQNLQRYVDSGGRVDARRLVENSNSTREDQERVLAAFERLGLERLGPVHEALHGTVTYDELHLLRLYLLCR